MKKFFIIIVLIPFFASSQTGIDFVHGLSWKEIQAKAKAENKYIFVDGWTTWCGPCIYMAKNIFPKDNVGKFFNANHISVKMQLDTSKKDDETVKRLYQDAHDLMTTYSINAFPTYLFFDPNGKLVHRAVGATDDADKFIAKGRDALDPSRQYYVLLDQYKAGKKDAAFLKQLANTAQEAYEMKTAVSISNAYLATQKDLLTAENIDFIDRFTNSTKDVGFKIIRESGDQFDKIKGAGAADRKIVNILLSEEVFPKIYGKGNTSPDWAAISRGLNTWYREYAPEVLSTARVNYFQRTRDWDNFQVAIIDYMKNYGSGVNASQLNEFAWTVFENCKDMSCVKEALDWSRKSLKDSENPMFIDTYANLLYKLGKTEEAITWEQKALALVSEDEKPSYQSTIDKMKKGEKTWN